MIMNTSSTYDIIAVIHDYQLMCSRIESGLVTWVIWVIFSPSYMVYSQARGCLFVQFPSRRQVKLINTRYPKFKLHNNQLTTDYQTIVYF